MLAPEDQQLWLRLLEPGLPLWIRRDVRAVVVEEFGLNLRLAWRVQKGVLIGPQIRVIALTVRIVSDMARLRGCQGQQILPQRCFMRRPVRPECPPCGPDR